MESIDIIGAGFVPGVPGLYGNCRVYYDGTTVRHVGPLYQEWSEQPPPEPEPPQPAPEPEPAQDQPQEVVAPPEPVIQQSNGG